MPFWGEQPAPGVAAVSRAILMRPDLYLLARWNWKSALLSALIRSALFYRATLGFGQAAARSASGAEFLLALALAGFTGAMAQAYRNARPRRLALVIAAAMPPLLWHGFELAAHVWNGTPGIRRGMGLSIAYSAMASLLTIFLMRRGVWLAGEERTPLRQDFEKILAMLRSRRPPEQAGRRAALLTLWRALIVLPFASREIFGACLGMRRLIAAHPAGPAKRYHRRFRVDAAILFLGVPIYRREDVGSGCATVETAGWGGRTVTALQFGAGSKPERSRGLNRLGLIREAVTARDGCLLETGYAGFMTSSPEKSLDQGRRALEKTAAGMPSSLGCGESGAGGTELSVGHFTIPATARWTDAARILDDVESRGACGRRETARFGPAATFLYAIRSAILDGASSRRREFCYNGALHELITEKQSVRDERRAQVRMAGAIRGRAGAPDAEFTAWFDPADPSGIPNRIEYRARSFLRLVFESEPGEAQAAPDLPWLIPG